jgi:hypothetical protein
MSPASTRGRAFWNTWNPQYFRSGDDVEEKSDSAQRKTEKLGIEKIKCKTLQTIDHYTEKFLKGRRGRVRGLGMVQELV